jgi:hypothetical protein
MESTDAVAYLRAQADEVFQENRTVSPNIQPTAAERVTEVPVGDTPTARSRSAMNRPVPGSSQHHFRARRKSFGVLKRLIASRRSTPPGAIAIVRRGSRTCADLRVCVHARPRVFAIARPGVTRHLCTALASDTRCRLMVY